MTPHASEPSVDARRSSAPSGVFQFLGVVGVLLVMAICFAPGAFL